MNGCEQNEVILRTLPPGACFELQGLRTNERGCVVAHLAGSTLVDTGSPHKEHWCYDCPVVPHPKANGSTWLKSNNEEENEMAKGKKVKATKEHRVIRFSVGKADPPEKYLDEKNTVYSALMYRSIKEAKRPVTFAEIFDDIKRSVANKTEGKTPKATLSVILAKMVKDGYVARREAKEEAKAVAA
jgi:hypothetical protein